jgi:N-acetyl-gamma-glutamyl-phosphate reductase
MGSDARISVGVGGATGYAGQELVRLLARHPRVALTATMASQKATARVLPGLSGIWDGPIEPFDSDRLQALDAVFLALPDEASADVVPALLQKDVRVFDLSGAFRLRDADRRARWYPTVPSLPMGTAYGMTERTAALLPGARLIACAGCYPTAAVLALAPLVNAGLVTSDIVIDAKSGVSGAGKAPSERTHFCEVDESLSAYGVFAHRHAAEIEQELGMDVTFVPHLVPLDRGILETIYLRVPSGTTDARIAEVYRQSYAGAPFVRLRGDALPVIKHVAHTNFCDIGWKLDLATGRLIVVSCLDNLLKGAAGQAVQNFNVAFGFDERLGLLQ